MDDVNYWFTCPVCRQLLPRYYRGATGHFVQVGDDHYDGDSLCWECWLDAWELMPYHGTDKTLWMLSLLFQGWKYTEVAQALGVTRKTIYRWRKKVRKNPEILDAICPIFPQKVSIRGRRGFLSAN